MFSEKAELVRDQLRECLLIDEIAGPDIRSSEAALTLIEGRPQDRKREGELTDWIKKVRTVVAVQDISAECRASRGEIS